MTDKPVILFRDSWDNRDEMAVARKYFPVYKNRAAIPPYSLVIGRYSVLPYYRELCIDLAHNGSALINDFGQHEYIADFHYYTLIRNFTFPSWNRLTFVHCNDPGPFVVKGATNSRKHRWNTQMYAETKQDAIRIGAELMDDPLIAEQGIIYRKYVPLKTFEIGINGVRFTNEWRFFFLGKAELCHQYYWSEASDVTSPRIDASGIALAHKVASLASSFVNFFVVDVAEKEAGGWVLVELNDAGMSGLSMNNPECLYSNLLKVLGG